MTMMIYGLVLAAMRELADSSGELAATPAQIKNGIDFDYPIASVETAIHILIKESIVKLVAEGEVDRYRLPRDFEAVLEEVEKGVKYDLPYIMPSTSPMKTRE